MPKRTIILVTFLLLSFCQPGQSQTRGSFTWDTAASLPGNVPADIRPGLAGPVAGTLNNFLLAGGGANFPEKMPWEGGRKEYHRLLFLYRAGADGKLLLEKTDSLPLPLAYAACTETTRGLLLAGGENAQGKSSRCYLIQYNARTKSLLFIPLPRLPQPSTHAMAVTWNNQVFLAGGETDSGTSAKMFVLDLDKLRNGWQPMPDLPEPVSDGVLLPCQAPGHAGIYLLGGRRRSPSGITRFLSDASRFNPATKSWTACFPLPHSLAAGTGIADASGKLFLLGGDEGKVYNQTERMMRALALETSLAKKDSLEQAGKNLQKNHPGFSRQILQYDPVANKWSDAGLLPAPAPVTTRAFRIGQYLYIPFGEIRAGVRSRVIWRGTRKSGKNHQHKPAIHAKDQ